MKKSFLGARSAPIGVVSAMLLIAQLTACGGGSSTPPPVGSDGPPATPPPTTTPPPPAPPKVTVNLNGTVTDAPIANAIVTATVAGETFTATADADGKYSLAISIAEADTDEFVTLNARGVGAQAFVEFTSLAGSFQALADAAGADKTLTSTENFATQITNVSTAAAVLMREANGGNAVTSDAALQSLAGNINAQDVLDLATTIKLAVDDAAHNPLPQGQATILALASDAAARQAFVDATFEKDPDAFAAAQSSIAQDPAMSRPLTTQSVEELGALTAGMLSSDAGFTFNYSGRISHFDFDTQGKGAMSTNTHDVQTTWAVQGSKIHVTFAEPIETVSYDTEFCATDDVVRQVEAHYVSTGIDIVFLSANQVALTSTDNITYADCASLLPREQTSTSARTVLSPDLLQVIDADELKGIQTLYVWDAAQQEVVADIADFGNGTGTTRLTGQSFTWTLEEDDKLIHAVFANGAEADYGTFGNVDDVVADIYWEVRAPNGGPVLVDAGAAVHVDPSDELDLTADKVVGRFYQFGIGEESAPDARLKGFRLRFDANFLGAQEYDYIDDQDALVTVNENVEPWGAFHWSLEGDSVVIRRTWDFVAEAYNCAYNATGCIVFDQRRIIPLVADGSRVYWVEERRSAPGGVVTEGTPATRLVRFYDHEQFAAGGASKPSLSTQGSAPRKLLRGLSLR